MADNYRLIEGDGIITNFFYFLWKRKSDASGALPQSSQTSGGGGSVRGSLASTNDHHHDSKAAQQAMLPWAKSSAVQFSPEFLIPSTVMFEHNYPKAWYYPTQLHTGGKAGSGGSWDLERKLGKDIDSASILKQFCPRSAAALEQLRAQDVDVPGDSGVGSGGALTGGSSLVDATLARCEELDHVAAYFSTAKSSYQASSNTGQQSASATDAGHDDAPSHRTVVEYMNEPQLRDFLLRRTQREDGFLQRWVWPNGKHNNVIQAVWTSHMCLVSRRRNKHAVRDTRESMYDRAVTYEGPPHLSEDSYVAPHIRYEIERFCMDLVKYMYHEHRIPMRRMVLHFKVDWNSQIWFLWASSVRVQDKSQINLTIAYVARHVLEEETRAAHAANQQQTAKDSGKTSPVTSPRSASGAKPLGSAPAAVSFPSSQQHLQKVHPPLKDKFLARQPPETQEFIRTLEAERHKSNIAFPKPPTMGPIGGLYTWGSLVDPLEAPPARKGRRSARSSAAPPVPHPPKHTPSFTAQSLTNKCTAVRPSSGRRPPPLDALVPTARTSEPASATPASAKKKKKRHSKVALPSGRSPKLDAMLRSLESGMHSAFEETPALLGNRPHQLATYAAAFESPVKRLFGERRAPRTGPQLWAFVSAAVRSGVLRRALAVQDAVDFFQLVQYSLYSHYLTSDLALTLPVPHTLYRGVPCRLQPGDCLSWVSVSTLLDSIGVETASADDIVIAATATRRGSTAGSPHLVAGSGGRSTAAAPRPTAPSRRFSARPSPNSRDDTAISTGSPTLSKELAPPVHSIMVQSVIPQQLTDCDATVDAANSPTRRVTLLVGSMTPWSHDVPAAEPIEEEATVQMHSALPTPSSEPPAVTAAECSNLKEASPAIAFEGSSSSSTTTIATSLTVVALHQPLSTIEANVSDLLRRDLLPSAAVHSWRLTAERWVWFRKTEGHLSASSSSRVRCSVQDVEYHDTELQVSQDAAAPPQGEVLIPIQEPPCGVETTSPAAASSTHDDSLPPPT